MSKAIDVIEINKTYGALKIFRRCVVRDHCVAIIRSRNTKYKQKSLDAGAFFAININRARRIDCNPHCVNVSLSTRKKLRCERYIYTRSDDEVRLSVRQIVEHSPR